MKVVVFSLGCKVNQYESQVLARKFFDAGFEVSDRPEYADIYIINTCSVTGEADKKSRQAISRMRKFNPNSRIYVCGCSSENSEAMFSNKKNVVFVSGTKDKNSIFSRVMSDINYNNIDYSTKSVPLSLRSRIYIKVQDGCNRFCSYCIIPYLRGRSRSRTIEDVCEEVKLVSEFADEVVLTGIDLSSYGLDINKDLSDLLIALKSLPIRKRLGSLECGVIDEKFIDACVEADVCEHFHISLQSGDNDVLQKMNRHYDVSLYAEKVEMIRKRFPVAAITTDLIAGFPGETEQQHKNTIKFAESMEFSDIHVFPYSQRKGTMAANMKQIPVVERERRAAELIEVKKRARDNFIDKNIGRREEVLIEEQANGYGVGYSRNYIRVFVPNVEKGLISVKLINKFNDGIKGEKL